MIISLPEGLVECGVSVSQKIEWFIWPPPLNLSAGAKLMIVAASSREKIENFTLNYITYQFL